MHSPSCVRAFLIGALSVSAPLAAWGQTTVFSGGSLDDLRTLSPSLVFGRLVIQGDLQIDLDNDTGSSDVWIQVDDLEITPSGKISYTQNSTSYLRPPNLTIDASGQAVINGRIVMYGKSGDSEQIGCQPTTYNSCYGKDGGDVVIRAPVISVTADIDVSGGWGQTLIFTSYDFYGICQVDQRIGCSGGDGGLVRLEASSRIDIDGADFDIAGGSGGSGIPSGADGALAQLEWDAPLTVVQEREPNGSAATDTVFPGPAQELAATPLRLSGFVSFDDDADDPNAISVEFPPPILPDRLEDLYRVFVDQARVVDIELEASDPSQDLDLYLLDGAVSQILGESHGPPPTIERIEGFLTPGVYIIGVSWCCPPVVLPPPPGTSYELRVLPEPAQVVLHAAAALTIAALWLRRRAARTA